MLSKVGRYENVVEPFHCDVNHELFMGHLGNHLLNAADFHSSDRGFGMSYLNTVNKTWVLSRLVIEMEEMPMQYRHFFVEAWVEAAMRYFTSRNFRVEGQDGKTLGFGRSIWALIDLDSRQPSNLLEINNGDIVKWVETDKECPIAKPGRVNMSSDVALCGERQAKYSDVDVNGHVNSVKYIEHVLDMFPLEKFVENRVARFEVAYVAESYFGDTLRFYREHSVQTDDGEEYTLSIAKRNEDGTETECVRSLVRFKKK